MNYALTKPIEFEGVTYKEIELDFDSLTGNDIILAEQMYTSGSLANSANNLKEYSREYQMHVAARASKMPVEFFGKLGALDFSLITLRVQNFFLGVSAE